MSDNTIPKILVGGAAVAAGYFAGLTAAISFIEQPTREELEKSAALQSWRASFDRAIAIQAPLSIAILGLSTAAAATTAASSKSSSSLTTPGVVLPLSAGLTFGGIFAYTMSHIMPTNHKLKDKETSEEEAVPLIKEWGRLHFVRTVASSVGFVALVTTLVLLK